MTLQTQVIPIPNDVQLLALNKALLYRGGFIAGGYARMVVMRLFATSTSPPPPGDIDVFLDRPDREHVIAGVLQEQGYAESQHSSPNVRVFNKAPEHDIDYLPVQLIVPIEAEYQKTFGPVEEVLEHFDMSTSMFAIEPVTMDEIQITWDDEGLEDSIERDIRLRHINCPTSVAQRVVKYAAKGYTISMRELHKLFMEWEARPEEYRDTLDDLLTRDDLSMSESELLYTLMLVD